MSIYQELGVPTIINAQGHFTALGGSLMPPEVLAAMVDAAGDFVRMDDLQRRVGERIAAMIGVEAAYVSGGASAALLVATGAILAGTDPERIARLPETDGRNEVIVQRSHRNSYDQAVRTAGARFVEIGGPAGATAEELERAFGERTAFALYVPINAAKGGIPLPEFVEIVHRHGLPVLVDAAAEVPPVENLRTFYDQGGDMVIFSGGKGLHGPQASGLILGRRKHVEACVPNGCPSHSIGRPAKAGKEEIAGLYRAIELYLKQDHAAVLARRRGWMEEVVARLVERPGVRGRVVVERGVPLAIIEVDAEQAGVSAAEVSRKLKEGDPPIHVDGRPGAIVVSTRALRPGEATVVARRIDEILMGVRRTPTWRPEASSTADSSSG